MVVQDIYNLSHLYTYAVLTDANIMRRGKVARRDSFHRAKENEDRRSDYKDLRANGISSHVARAVRDWRGTKVNQFIDTFGT